MYTGKTAVFQDPFKYFYPLTSQQTLSEVYQITRGVIPEVN